MKQVAVGWLVYRLTDSALLLGVLAFSREISIFLFSMVAGVVADRYNKHRLLILCQSLISLNAFALAYFTLSGAINVPLLIFMEILFGLISGLEMPSRQSFVNDLVEDKSYLTNAIALNSSLFNTARIVGPAIAGVLIPLIGEGYCFLIYAIASFSVVIVFSFIRYRETKSKNARIGFGKEFVEGARYSFGTKHTRFLLLFIAGITFLGVSYMVILPVFAAEVFDGGSEVFGYMTSAVGVGSLIGAFLVGTRNKILGLDKLILLGTVVFGVGLAIFSLSSILWISLIALLISGFGRVVVFTSTNTLLQTISPGDKRGRVLALYIMLFMGSLSVGSIFIGVFTDWIGGPLTLLMGSMGLLGMAFYYSRNLEMLRKRIYKVMRKTGLA